MTQLAKTASVGDPIMAMIYGWLFLLGRDAFDAIVLRLDVMMALPKVKSKALVQFTGTTEANFSKLKTGQIKAVRLSGINE